MRIEATIADASGQELIDLARELGVSKSQIVEEAVALWLKAILEAKRGRRVAIIDANSRETVCEVVSPILTQLEWAHERERVTLGPDEAETLERALANPPEPTPALRRAMTRKPRT